MCLDLKPSFGVARVPCVCDKRECAVRTPMPPGTMTHNCLVSTCGTARRQRDTEEDFERLRLAVDTLNVSGWYHGAMNFAEAKRKLRHSDIGTFLVRDSSASNYLFTLSVKTTRGTTSVRIEYEDGKFNLDSEEAMRSSAPSYDCVVKLVHHYLKMTDTKPDGNGNNDKAICQQRKSVGNGVSNSGGQMVWLEPSGRRDLVAKFSKPLRSCVPSLQHLCRVSLNRYVEPRHQADLPLPGKLKAYLKQYPFDQ